MTADKQGFRTLRHQERCLTIAPSVPEQLAREWLTGDPLAQGIPLEDLGQRDDLRLLETSIGPVVAKRSTAQGHRALRARLGRGRARHCFELGLLMHSRGIATPEPLAWLREDTRGRASVLITRRAPGRTGWRVLSSGAAKSEREKLTVALAQSAESMHRIGIRHRDLKVLNFCVDALADPWCAWILDLDGARQRRPPLGMTLIERDLGRLAASFLSDAARAAGLGEEDWQQLIACYAGRSKAPIEEEKLVRRTLQWAHEKVARNKRLGLPLR